MTNPSRRLVLAGAACAALAPRATHAAPRAELLDARWTRHGAAGDPDHSAWESFLLRFRRDGSDGIARVSYGAAQGEAGTLRRYIDALAAVDPTTLTPAAGYAYWVNLYNALTVMLVLEEWPVETIWTVRGGVFDTGPWDVDAVRVNGTDLTLDDIEHRILRPVWRDPRIHYAVNCAALGCPNLAARAYTADRLETMLEANARAYVNHPRGVRLAGGDLTVSSIYDWFQDDFGGSEAGVLEHLRRYAEPGLAATLAGRTGYDDHAYDWSINAA